jgi:pimeloyl-ACP methyl ester carboxylesterase
LNHREDEIDVRGCPVPMLTGGSGPGLLLLHGAGAARRWLEFHDRLASRFTVYAPVHPGFGGTPLPGWVKGTEDLALHYVDLIRTLALEKPLVVGLSLGGWIATELAVFRSDLIGGLVLVGAIGVKPERPIPDLFIMDPMEAVGYLFADPAKAMVLMPQGATVDGIVRMWEEQAAIARLTWKRPYNPQLRRRLHHVAVPTLVVWGGKDRLIAPEHGRMLAREIEGARFELIEGSGHVVAIEQPAKLAEAIARLADSIGLAPPPRQADDSR